jgi:hypothetical protein
MQGLLLALGIFGFQVKKHIIQSIGLGGLLWLTPMQAIKTLLKIGPILWLNLFYGGQPIWCS